MALFGLNWEESKWPGHFCPAVPTFSASKIGVKLPPEKKVPWHRRWAALGRGSNCHFCQKNAFFGQKMTFFQKVHFIQKCSVTQNTVFQCVKNIFFLSQKKLVFFTEFNLKTNRRLSTSSPASQPQPYQGAGLHKIEATVREVKNSMLTNPLFMGIKRTVYWCWSQPCMISEV